LFEVYSTTNVRVFNFLAFRIFRKICFLSSRYRHAAPSGPWPWVDFNTDFSASEPPFNEGAHEWSGYPQKLFGNWTSIPVARSKMLTQCAEKGPCIIYGIDVTNDGTFHARKPGLDRIKVSTGKETEFWSNLKDKESIIFFCFFSLMSDRNHN
jgi:hypothetical protein